MAIGAAYNGADVILGGLDSVRKGGEFITTEELLTAMGEGAIAGFVFRLIAPFLVLRSIATGLIAISGVQGSYDALEKGNYIQAAFRITATVSIVKKITQENWNSRACFTGDTLISTEDGLRAIQDIKVGDQVYSENPETGETGLKRVVKVLENEVNVLVHIQVGEEEITTTLLHPFWVVGKGWTEAGELQAGDQVKLYNGEEKAIIKVEIEELEESIIVYNFEVEDWHTYFVGEARVFVHNASCSGGAEQIDINVKPDVTNSKLKNIINDLYKGQGGANTIGNGTTMDAVRNEIITGEATNGKFHTQKLNDYVNALQKRLRAGDLNAYDESVAKAILEDALNALAGN
jgi:hypothetical protein